jgi:CheY-like chemotaxis protein
MINVIYIDDEADTEKMKSIFEMLEDNDIKIIPVVYVNEALSKIRTNSKIIDLIILDLIMPPYNFYKLEETNGGISTGIRLLEDIRKEFVKIPIIIVSKNNKKYYSSDIIKKYNVLTYLEKPITAYRLAQEIKTVLNYTKR